MNFGNFSFHPKLIDSSDSHQPLLQKILQLPLVVPAPHVLGNSEPDSAVSSDLTFGDPEILLGRKSLTGCFLFTFLRQIFHQHVKVNEECSWKTHKAAAWAISAHLILRTLSPCNRHWLSQM